MGSRPQEQQVSSSSSILSLSSTSNNNNDNTKAGSFRRTTSEIAMDDEMCNISPSLVSIIQTFDEKLMESTSSVLHEDTDDTSSFVSGITTPPLTLDDDDDDEEEGYYLDGMNPFDDNKEEDCNTLEEEPSRDNMIETSSTSSSSVPSSSPSPTSNPNSTRRTATTIPYTMMIIITSLCFGFATAMLIGVSVPIISVQYVLAETMMFSNFFIRFPVFSSHPHPENVAKTTASVKNVIIVSEDHCIEQVPFMAMTTGLMTEVENGGRSRNEYITIDDGVDNKQGNNTVHIHTAGHYQQTRINDAADDKKKGKDDYNYDVDDDKMEVETTMAISKNSILTTTTVRTFVLELVIISVLQSFGVNTFMKTKTIESLGRQASTRGILTRLVNALRNLQRKVTLFLV